MGSDKAWLEAFAKGSGISTLAGGCYSLGAGAYWIPKDIQPWTPPTQVTLPRSWGSVPPGPLSPKCAPRALPAQSSGPCGPSPIRGPNRRPWGLPGSEGRWFILHLYFAPIKFKSFLWPQVRISLQTCKASLMPHFILFSEANSPQVCTTNVFWAFSSCIPWPLLPT